MNWVISKHGGETITKIFRDYASNPNVPTPELSSIGITLPDASKLWIADDKESEALQNKWVAEWDQIYRNK